MVAYLNGSVCDASLSEMIEEVQFLNQSSAGTKPQRSFSTNQTTPETLISEPLEGLSNLVNRFETVGSRKGSRGRVVEKRQNSLKRKATTVTRTQVLVDGPVREEFTPQTAEQKQPRLSLDGSTVMVPDDVQSWNDDLIHRGTHVCLLRGR